MVRQLYTFRLIFIIQQRVKMFNLPLNNIFLSSFVVTLLRKRSRGCRILYKSVNLLKIFPSRSFWYMVNFKECSSGSVNLAETLGELSDLIYYCHYELRGKFSSVSISGQPSRPYSLKLSFFRMPLVQKERVLLVLDHCYKLFSIFRNTGSCY